MTLMDPKSCFALKYLNNGSDIKMLFVLFKWGPQVLMNLGFPSRKPGPLVSLVGSESIATAWVRHRNRVMISVQL